MYVYMYIYIYQGMTCPRVMLLGWVVWCISALFTVQGASGRAPPRNRTHRDSPGTDRVALDCLSPAVAPKRLATNGDGGGQCVVAVDKTALPHMGMFASFGTGAQGLWFPHCVALVIMRRSGYALISFQSDPW